MTETIINIKDVSFHYETRTVLENIDFQVQEGQFWALIGPNGSGKSTLIKILLGLLKPDKGSVELFDEPIESFHHRELIGYVSQKSNSFNSGFPATVLEVVRSGLTRKKGLLKRFTKEDTKQAIDALKVVQMDEFAHKNIGELSGGQQQRVFIARALVGKPKLLVMDEPTVGIDQQNVASFYHMLNELNREHRLAILLVTHEVDIVTELATHIACLNRSIHFHGGKAEFHNMDESTLSKWYGHPVMRVHHEEGECHHD